MVRTGRSDTERTVINTVMAPDDSHPGLVGDANHQRSEKHMEHCVACQKSNEKVEMSKDFIVSIPEAQKFTATLSIAGMTCAACILSISEGCRNWNS